MSVLIHIFFFFNSTTYLSHIGWQQRLQFLDDEQTKRTGGVQQLLRRRTTGNFSRTKTDAVFLSYLNALLLSLYAHRYGWKWECLYWSKVGEVPQVPSFWPRKAQKLHTSPLASKKYKGVWHV